VLTAALEAAGTDAVWVDAREVVITDSSFGRALPDFAELTRRAHARLGSLLDRAAVPVTQGFIGATPQGITTTVGRGGSDLTAALLGAALAAEEVQIWTDVHGLMTADPRVVPGARPLAEASYDEAAELAYFGAKVLHPATMIPVIEAGIPLHIRNATDPGAQGTRVSAHPSPQPGGVKSIASKRGVTTIFLQAPRMLGAFGYLRRMFEVFDRNEVAVDVVSTSEVSVSLSIERGAVTDQLVEELERLGRVQVRRDGAIICVVGEALRETPGIAARIFRAIESVNIQMISQGASKINVTLVVDDAQAVDAVTRLHAEFFG
jgi:aspartate kinase